MQPDTGFTITFAAFLDEWDSDHGRKPFYMGMLSQCDCVCNRADARYEPLHPGGFLLLATNCLDPLNYTGYMPGDPNHKPRPSNDPHCLQDKFVNLSLLVANTNFTSPDGKHINASVDHGRIGDPAWSRLPLEGPPMLTGTWNNITVVWQPTSLTELGSGVLNLTVFNPAIDPQPRTASHSLVNASNLFAPKGTPWDAGTSRFPNRSPCQPFFGKLRDLDVWNGVDCAPAMHW